MQITSGGCLALAALTPDPILRAESTQMSQTTVSSSPSSYTIRLNMKIFYIGVCSLSAREKSLLMPATDTQERKQAGARAVCGERP